MTPRLLFAATLLVGCAPSARLVRDVTVYGNDLVVETCSLGSVFESCMTKHEPIPALALPAAPELRELLEQRQADRGKWPKQMAHRGSERRQ